MESKLNTLTRKIKKRYLEYISEQSYYKLTNKGIVSEENIKIKAGKKKKKSWDLLKHVSLTGGLTTLE